jgi:hypothetical protein
MMMGWMLLLLAQDPQYDTLMLETGGRADTIVTPDLNADTFPDLVIQSGRDLHVFLFEKGRGFTAQPQQTLRLDPSVFVWCLGTLGGQKFPALLTQGSRAIQAHPFDGQRFGPAKDLVVHPTLFEGLIAEGKPPVYIEFAPDLGGAGRSDLILYEKDDLLLMRPDEGGRFRCWQRFPVSAECSMAIPWASHMKLAEVAAVPILAWGDMDGDGRTDLVCYRDEALGVFRQGPDGHFAGLENRDLTREKNLRKPRRLMSFEIPPRIADFNGDGLLDVALVYPSKGRVHVYFGRAGRTDFTQPDQIFEVADGWSSGIYTEPLASPKKIDLIMGVVRKFGITGGIQAFLSGKVEIELHIYAMQDTGRFSKDPVQELKYSIPYTFHVTRDSMNLDLVFRPNFKGHFTKDGRRDMLVAESEKTLRIYPGVPDRYISDTPKGTILMNPPEGVSYTEPFMADFNQDGISDLVLRHVLTPEKQAVELKLSR